MLGERRQIGTHGESVDLDEVRVAVTKERSAGLRGTDVRVVAVHAADGEEGELWELEVESDEPLPGPREWTGASIARDLVARDGGAGTWRATVLDVDSPGGRLFVEGPRPSEGLAVVWPFDYLASLFELASGGRHEGLRDVYARLLAATEGGQPPVPVPARGVDPAWAHAWVQVWGPPGTGKTWTLGRQVAALLDDSSERVLVVSTTNRATDAAAAELGQACRERGRALDRVWRVGRVVRPQELVDRELGALLPDADALHALATTQAQLAAASGSERLYLRGEQRRLAQRIPGLSRFAQDPQAQAIVTTLYGAVGLLRDEGVLRILEEGRTPFTTVVVDEAGLVGRASAAAVALLASRRVVLVGDPRQLSPIARAARSLPSQVVRWLARSGLDHLRADRLGPQVQALMDQRRMHPDIGAAVSSFQYDGALRSHPSVSQRPVPAEISHLPRLLWYVLDEHPDRGAEGASSRLGPGGRSRVRPLSEAVFRALAEVEPQLGTRRGLFITPYVAQAEAAQRWLDELGWTNWSASTVHRQQGAEASVVVFDTVHASSTGWPPHEWRRLVNVGLSRARDQIILLASRVELDQPWMRPLVPHMAPRVLRRRSGMWRWREPDGLARAQSSLFGRAEPQLEEPQPEERVGDGLGDQLSRRRAQRAVLSAEQSALIHRELSDAGPRLVRGVAGSGKTLVLAHWAVRTLRGQGFEQVVVLYANKALSKLIERMLVEAWEQQHEPPRPSFPWERVRLLHVRDLLEDLRREAGLPDFADRFDYEAQAQTLMEAGPWEPRFPALFLDEAQDFGHATLELAISLVREHRGRKPVLVFYDDAQNVYQRRPPSWAQLGVDMTGRTDIMRESFRSSRPVAEVALNLVHQLTGDLRSDRNYRELERKGLLVAGERGGRDWWEARFCADDGELPEVEVFDSRDQELDWVCRRVQRLLREGVAPGDIRIVTLSRGVREALLVRLRQAVDVPVVQAASGGYEDHVNRLVITTPHSFKGYDAEVVLVPGIDRFAPAGRVLVPILYVCLTRARTLLLASGARSGSAGSGAEQLVSALSTVGRQLLHPWAPVDNS